ncbi:MAG: tRNA N6-adenosine threonylcarbamoyltransferase [bacterium ADurb.Bin429]|nr:MAG: tRNA N6-adenosine threonylcarbamoyltransferase [bacterium ADurb.Bin429]
MPARHADEVVITCYNGAVMTMLILGVESSCDETAASVVADGRVMLSNVVSSSEQFHKEYGGIVPEIASRKQLEYLLPVFTAALEKAGITPVDLAAVAVAHGPGLIGSLVVGLMGAKAFAYVHNLPLVGVNHLEGHLYANWIRLPDDPRPEPQLPALVLVVSGGHAHMVWMQNHGDYRILGRTRDDAPGEALDKAARLLDLGYPGGPVIDRLGKEGDPKAVAFPRALLPGTHDFSFSGLKTALAQYLRKTEAGGRAPVADIAASFQEAIMTVLVDKLFAAADLLSPARVVLAGGVAANSRLRELAEARAEHEGIPIALPPRVLCTDNAAMVAAAGYFRALREEFSDQALDASASLPLAG